MKRILLLIGVLVVCIGLLAACGGDDDDDDAGDVVSEVSTEVGGATDETPEMTETESESTGTEAEGTGTEAAGTGTEASGTGTEASGTGTEASGTGTESSGTGTEASGTGTESEGTGTEASGTGTEASGTGTESEGTGTEANGTGTSGEGQTFQIGDEIEIGDLTFIVQGTTDDVDVSAATPAEGMEFLGVEIDLQGEVTNLTDLPDLFQDVHLEDASGASYDLNMAATTEMLSGMSMDSSATGTPSDSMGGTVTLTAVFDVPADVDDADLTLVGSTPDGETFMVPLSDEGGAGDDSGTSTEEESGAEESATETSTP